MALLPNAGIQAFISSAKNKIEHFISGFAGHGWKIWEWTSGRYKLEIDDLTIRRTMTVYELIISKIRSIAGAMAITQAHGKIKSVDGTSDPYNYLITLEDTNTFVEYDFIRMEEFTGLNLRSYWVQVSEIRGETVVIPKSEFENNIKPETGDEIVQFGNEYNEGRQSAIYLHADETGQPAIDVMFGINSKSFDGKVKLRLGAGLPGVSDDFKGLYAENGMLKFTDKQGNITSQIWPDGTAELGAGSVKINPDKSGFIGGENGLSWHWDTAKNKFICEFGSDAILQWGSLSDEAKENLKGRPGIDGTSYSFVYCSSADQPTKPTGTTIIPTGWSEIPTEVTDKLHLWMSQALIENGEAGEWSEPVRISGLDGKNGEDGKDGNDGKDGEGIQGEQGIQGCILRKSEWQPGVEYRNDEDNTEGTRYIDIALIRDDALDTGWQAYKCLQTHVSSDLNSPENSTEYWERFQINANSIFTSLIIAKDAQIDFMSGNELRVLKNGKPTAGISGKGEGENGIRFWAGGQDPKTANFRIDENGNGKFSGEINATSGIFNSTDSNGNAKISGSSLTITSGFGEHIKLSVFGGITYPITNPNPGQMPPGIVGNYAFIVLDLPTLSVNPINGSYKNGQLYKDENGFVKIYKK